MNRGDHDDARRIRAALTNPRGLCEALDLIPEGGRGRTWFVDGRDALRIPCPWHGERTGSCSVRTGPDGTVQVRCFGCDAGGDALTLVAQVRGLDPRADFRAVLEQAAAIAGVRGPAAPTGSSPFPRRPAAPARPRGDASAAARSSAPTATADADDDAADGGALDAVVSLLRTLAPVTGSPAAMFYLRDRCIAHGAALGWIALPDDPEAFAELGANVCAGVGRDAWKRAGLCWPSGMFAPKWRGRVCIPWEAPNGAVESLQGRPIGEPREGEPKYTAATAHPPRWPWGSLDVVECAGDGAVVAIVEGAVDALSWEALARGAGVDGFALGIPGVSSVSRLAPGWTRIVRGRRVVVALDADAAGERARDELVALVRPEAASVEVRGPVEGKDWNDTARARRAAERGAA